MSLTLKEAAELCHGAEERTPLLVYKVLPANAEDLGLKDRIRLLATALSLCSDIPIDTEVALKSYIRDGTEDAKK